jgi:hypothetical protein
MRDDGAQLETTWRRNVSKNFGILPLERDAFCPRFGDGGRQSSRQTCNQTGTTDSGAEPSVLAD